MNEDFQDVLSALLRAGARFLVVGAHAMAAHGVPRATGDLDVWVDPASDNADRVWQALLEFGAPLTALSVSKRDLETPEHVVQIGLPPQRIDILTSVTGVDFETAWTERIVHQVDSSRSLDVKRCCKTSEGPAAPKTWRTWRSWSARRS